MMSSVFKMNSSLILSNQSLLTSESSQSNIQFSHNRSHSQPNTLDPLLTFHDQTGSKKITTVINDGGEVVSKKMNDLLTDWLIGASSSSGLSLKEVIQQGKQQDQVDMEKSSKSSSMTRRYLEFENSTIKPKPHLNLSTTKQFLETSAIQQQQSQHKVSSFDIYSQPDTTQTQFKQLKLPFIQQLRPLSRGLVQSNKSSPKNRDVPSLFITSPQIELTSPLKLSPQLHFKATFKKRNSISSSAPESPVGHKFQAPQAKFVSKPTLTDSYSLSQLHKQDNLANNPSIVHRRHLFTTAQEKTQQTLLTEPRLQTSQESSLSHINLPPSLEREITGQNQILTIQAEKEVFSQLFIDKKSSRNQLQDIVQPVYQRRANDNIDLKNKQYLKEEIAKRSVSDHQTCPSLINLESSNKLENQQNTIDFNLNETKFKSLTRLREENEHQPSLEKGTKFAEYSSKTKKSPNKISSGFLSLRKQSHELAELNSENQEKQSSLPFLHLPRNKSEYQQTSSKKDEYLNLKDQGKCTSEHNETVPSMKLENNLKKNQSQSKFSGSSSSAAIFVQNRLDTIMKLSSGLTNSSLGQNNHDLQPGISSPDKLVKGILKSPNVSKTFFASESPNIQQKFFQNSIKEQITPEKKMTSSITINKSADTITRKSRMHSSAAEKLEREGEVETDVAQLETMLETSSPFLKKSVFFKDTLVVINMKRGTESIERLQNSSSKKHK